MILWIQHFWHNAWLFKKCCYETRSGVKDVILTVWGDDGGECSRFAVLPSLFYASEIAKGNYDIDIIKSEFKDKFSISFDEFMALDLLKTPNKNQKAVDVGK